MEQDVDGRIPDRIATWIESTLGPWAPIADVSWPRSDSRVWQVRLGEADAFVKISPSAEAFLRERSALVDVLPGAMAATTPSLLGSADNLLTLVTSRVDGEVVRTLSPLPPPDVERAIHARAGVAIRSVHRQIAQRADLDVDRARSTRGPQLLELADRRLLDCRRLMGVEDLRSIDLAKEVLADAAAACEVGFIHGDFQPRNWLWSTPRREIAMIDFEESEIGYGVEDFGWLFATTWDRRNDLKKAFLEGYGRALTDSEWLFLAAFTVLGSLQHIADGERRGISCKIANGMRALKVSSRALAESSLQVGAVCRQRVAVKSPQERLTGD